MKKDVRLKMLQFATYFAAILWVTSGLITIGSIYVSRIGLIVNLVIGILFMIIGLYFHLKEKHLQKLMVNSSVEKNSLYKQVIFEELILIVLTIFIGAAVFSAVTSRVFGEGLAVFG